MTVPAYSHIVVEIEENHGYGAIVGNAAAPYINHTLIADGQLLTNYHALSHPSEPNYFGMYAGSTFGIQDDGVYHEPDPTLATILQGAGKTFKGVTYGYTDYGHDPWTSFPEGNSVHQTWASSAFATNNFAALPTVSFLVPDDDLNMHNNSVASGDAWLSTHDEAYRQWAAANNSLLVTVWDENTGAAGNRVAAILDGAHVTAGTTDATSYNHYNLLSTLLASSGLAGPRNAATAAPFGGFAPLSPPHPIMDTRGYEHI